MYTASSVISTRVLPIILQLMFATTAACHCGLVRHEVIELSCMTEL